MPRGPAQFPGESELMRLPKAVRVAIELVIGVPIVFGIARYFIRETADLLWFLGTPIRRISAAVPRR